ncbi:MAG TPA: ABC transporter permease subunit [Verrucomicrobiae bacterium]|jgi:hypothetical protein
MSGDPPPVIRGPDAVRPLPGWPGALRGIWLMTWRSQLNLRRLPGQLAVLLVLPVLVCMTMRSPRQWAARHISMGEPFQQVNTFVHRLQRKQIPIEPKTAEDLKAAVSEANRQSESKWIEIRGENPENRRKRAEDFVAAWHANVLKRAHAILNASQYDEFSALQQRNRDNAARRLTQIDRPWSRTEPFYQWLIGFYFFIILPLTCARLCGPLIRDELQADTLGFLITRPIGRARLLIAKYIAQTAWLEIILLLETLLIFAAGSVRQVENLGPLLLLVLAVQILVIPTWSALGVLLGQATTRYMAAALLYGGLVEMCIGNIPTNINSLSIIRHLETLLAHNSALKATFTNWPEGQTAAALEALVIAPVLFLAAATLLFSLMEYHHAAEMQK